MAGNETERMITEGLRRKRSKILYQITAMIVVVFVITGCTSFILFRSSQERLAQQGIDKLIETRAQDFSSAFGVTGDFIAAEYMARATEPDAMGEFLQYLLDRKVTLIQSEINQRLKQMLEGGLLGIELLLVMLPPGTISSESLVVISSDESLIYTWQSPDYVLNAFKEDKSYVYLPDGMPELGLEGEQLLLLYRYEGVPTTFWIIGTRPMKEDVREIEAFFENESRKTTLMLALVIAGSVIVAIIITFFILSHLIRKQITEPIDQLSKVAGRVMQGDLDVDIEVREGEDFEGLKRVFKEMVDSIRLMIERSTRE